MNIFIKTIFSDKPQLYKSIDEIRKELLECAWFVDCSDNNLENINFIKNFPYLKDLVASNNFIKEFPDHDYIQNLTIANNSLYMLPKLPDALTIDASNNRINIIDKYFKIQYLDISWNKLNKIILYPSLIKAYLSNNNIDLIDISYDYNYNIKTLNCDNNLIKDINFIFFLKKLIKFSFKKNCVNFIPQHIYRLLLKIDRKPIIIHKTIHNIRKKNLEKIHTVMIIKYLPIELCLKEIHESNFLTDICKNKLIHYSQFELIDHNIYIMFRELLAAVWTIIRRNKLHIQMKFKLNTLYKDISKCECLSCNLVKLVSCLEIETNLITG